MDGVAVFIEVNDSVMLWISDPVSKHRSTTFCLHRPLVLLLNSSSVENVVAEHQGATLTGDELFTDDECLC